MTLETLAFEVFRMNPMASILGNNFHLGRPRNLEPYVGPLWLPESYKGGLLNLQAPQAQEQNI